MFSAGRAKFSGGEIMRDRAESLELAKSKEFDLAIIGGGIAGVGVAQNAAARGLSVLLLEKSDFSSGTSSKTTKLIHGGLRYLETFHFNLTRQLCEERERLKNLAPHLVKDFSFVLPMMKDATLFNLKINAGLTLYDLLAISKGIPHCHSILSKRSLSELAPALNASEVGGGLKFFDAITDDSRMVLTVLKSACNLGAVALNYMQVDGLSTDDKTGAIFQANCHDRVSGKREAFRAKVFVNATGVWTDGILNILAKAQSQRVVPSKGIHIIVPASAFETNTALFLPTKDKRFVFVVPWLRALMIGTTDELYTGDIDRPRADADEIDYLLSVVNSYTQSQKLNRSDVTASFAGLRPLVKFDDSQDTSSMSREHLIFESEGGLINVAGGKLTSYRIMAEEIVDKVSARFPDQRLSPANTGKTMLGGWQGKEDFLTSSAAIAAKARKVGIEPASIEHLIANYGNEAEYIVELAEREPHLKEKICADFPPIMAEVPFCVINEMAMCLEDLLFRRLRLGILNHKACLEAAPKVGALLKNLLNWDERRLSAELNALEAEIGNNLEILKTC